MEIYCYFIFLRKYDVIKRSACTYSKIFIVVKLLASVIIIILCNNLIYCSYKFR